MIPMGGEMECSRELIIEHARDIYNLVGNGKYQLAVIATGLLAMFAVSMQEFIQIFAAFDQGWQCRENSSTCLLNGTISPANNLRCSISRTEWKFVGDKSFSIVNEFDLECQRDYWIALSTALFYLSNMIGALVLGTLSDRYGRCRTTFWCTTIVLCSCFAGAFVSNLWSFELLRVINGFFMPGTYMVMLILTSEIVSSKYRNTAVNAYWISYGLGVSLLGLVAYYVQNWRNLLIYSSAPYFICIILLWFVPESFIWLHAQGKEEKLLAQIKRVARFNKRNIPSNIVFRFPSQTEQKSESESIVVLYKSRKGLLVTLPMTFSWFSLGLIYYGIEMVSANITGNPYRDYILLTMVEIPSAFIAMYSIKRFGRHVTTKTGLFIGGINMIICGFIPNTYASRVFPVLRLILALIAKVATSVSYNVIIIWSAELYPTNLRSKANGLFNCWYMIGAVSAPWVSITLERIHGSVPFFTMGGSLVISAFTIWNVPETKGKELPEISAVV